MRAWDVGTGKATSPPMMHYGEIGSVAISRDNTTILSGSRDGTARFWDRATGKPMGQALGPFGAVDGVAIHPNGKQAVTGSRDHFIRFWTIPTPLDGEVPAVVASLQMATGMELNDDGIARTLSTRRWEELRKQTPRP